MSMRNQGNYFSKDQSRRNSHIFDIVNTTINKENEYPQVTYKTVKKIDRAVGSLNKIYQQAIQDQQCIKEQAGMMMEDLNGKLLQRAELIGTYEELEELLECHRKDNKFEYEFAKKVERLEQQITQQKKHSSFKLSQLTADLIKDRENAHKLLKERIQSETNHLFQQYLNNQGEQFNKIREQYGDEIHRQMQWEHHDQIQSIIQSQYSKKIQAIITTLRNYDKIECQIQQNVNYIDGQLAQDILNIQYAMAAKKEQVSHISQTLIEDKSQDNNYFWKTKVQHLELEKMHLEEQLVELTLRMDGSQSNYQPYNQKHAEELYNKILTGSNSKRNSSKQHSSTKQNRSYSEINNQRQSSKRENKQPKDESLHFSQFVDSCIGVDTSKGSSVCQLSADDSLLQHFNDLNISMMQSDRRQSTINMPLQRQEKIMSVADSTKDPLRLHTIAEEQGSTKREQSKIDRTDYLKYAHMQNTQSTLSTTKLIQQSQQSTLQQQIQQKLHPNIVYQSNNNGLQLKDTQKIQPLFFTNQSNPTTMKNTRVPQIFQFKEQSSSEQITKHQKSRSFDYTSNREAQQKKLINQKTNETFSRKESTLMPLEQEILKIARPLTQNILIYKRFSTKTNLTKQEFNPYSTADPLNTGYGSRMMQISSSFDRVEFRNQLKPMIIDSFIPLEQVMRCQISKQTSQLVQLKRRVKSKMILSPEEKQISQVIYWPLSIITERDGRVELLFQSEDLMEQWSAGLTFLRDNLKTLLNISRKLKKTI